MFISKEDALKMQRKDGMAFFFDMDGCLAKWKKSSIEETFKDGYFYDLEPEPELICTVNDMHQCGFQVFILSKVYSKGSAARDKARWLKKHGLDHVPHIFVPYESEEKSGYVRKDAFNILIDDFSKNLHEWKDKGNLGFKFLNGINGTHGTWTGYTLDHRMSSDQMYTELTAIGEKMYQNR